MKECVGVRGAPFPALTTILGSSPNVAVSGRDCTARRFMEMEARVVAVPQWLAWRRLAIPVAAAWPVETDGVYDLTTGSASRTPARIAQIKSHLPPGYQNIPPIEIRL